MRLVLLFNDRNKNESVEIAYTNHAVKAMMSPVREMTNFDMDLAELWLYGGFSAPFLLERVRSRELFFSYSVVYGCIRLNLQESCKELGSHDNEQQGKALFEFCHREAVGKACSEGGGDDACQRDAGKGREIHEAK